MNTNKFVCFCWSIIFLRVVLMMFISMLVIMVLLLVSCFHFWLSNDNKSILNQLSYLLSFKFSSLWLWATARAWRRSVFWFLILILWFEVRFLVISSLIIITTSFFTFFSWRIIVSWVPSSSSSSTPISSVLTPITLSILVLGGLEIIFPLISLSGNMLLFFLHLRFVTWSGNLSNYR